MIIAVCGMNSKENSKEKERKVVPLGIKPRASGLSHRRSQGQRLHKVSNSNGPDDLSLDDLHWPLDLGAPSIGLPVL